MYPEANTAPILATMQFNGALTASFYLKSLLATKLYLPSTWSASATSLTVQVSADNATFSNLYRADTGSEYTLSGASASRCLLLNGNDLIGVHYIRFRSGTSASPVSQSGSVVLTVVPW